MIQLTIAELEMVKNEIQEKKEERRKDRKAIHLKSTQKFIYIRYDDGC